MTDTSPPSPPAPPSREPAIGAPPSSAQLRVHVRDSEPREVDLTRAAPFGWWPAVAIALVAFIDRVEVNLIAGALPAIQDHFGFSDTVAGLIPTAASIAAAALLLPAGRLADRAPRVLTIVVVVLVWSLCSVLTGLATSFALFFAVRIAIGAAGQLYNPPASSLISDYHPVASRGKAFGLERAGYYMGLPAGVILGGAVAEAWDWRAVFFLAAAPGLVIAVLMATVREPMRGLGDRIDALTSGRPDPGEVVAPEQRTGIVADARALLRIPTLRGVITAQALLSLGVAGLFYWLPSLLERTEDLATDAASGLAGAVGGTGIVIGIVLGSRLGDRTEADGWRLKVSMVALTVGAIGLSGAVVLPGVAVRMTLVTLACIGFAAAMPNLTATAATVVPSTTRGMGFALLQFLTTLGGAFGPLLVGVASDAFGSLSSAMLCLVPPLFVCIGFLLGARRHHDVDAEAARR